MDTGTRWRTTTLGRGAAVGAVGFVVGYLLTWILAGTDAARLTVGGPFGGSIPNWRALLWVFYDAHFVGTRTPGVFGPGGERLGGGELVDTVGVLDVTFLYAVPVGVLLLGGGVVATWAGVSTPREGLEAGVTVAVGYFVVTGLGLFVATQGGVAPSPLRALVIAGVVYPVTLGGGGGVVAGLYRRSVAAPAESST